MENVIKIISYSFFSGITVFLGGLLSKLFERFFPEGFIKKLTIHTAIALGGGIIVGAVAFVLVPESMNVLPVFPMTLIFLAGAVFFFFVDRLIQEKGGALSQLLAMLLDFVPEAIALGAIFAHDHRLGLLIALFIGLQNFPESFDSYLDLRNSGLTSKKCIFLLFLLSFSGVIASLCGYYFLTDFPKITAALMLFSSGGILYLIFQDIAPMSKLEKIWFPALGASFGFLIGMIGEKFLG